MKEMDGTLTIEDRPLLPKDNRDYIANGRLTCPARVKLWSILFNTGMTLSFISGGVFNPLQTKQQLMIPLHYTGTINLL